MSGYRGTLEEFLEEEKLADLLPLRTPSSSSSKDDHNPLRCRHLVLLCVHSHVRFRKKAHMDKIRSAFDHPRTTLVSIPCCPKFRHVSDIGRPPDVKYEDDCIFSACRDVSVWNFKG